MKRQLFYSIAEALTLFPLFVNKATVKELVRKVKGTPPKITKLFSRGAAHRFKPGKRMDFRKSLCRDSTRVQRDGINYVRRQNKMSKLSVGLVLCFNASCNGKTLLAVDKRHPQKFCKTCNETIHTRIEDFESGSIEDYLELPKKQQFAIDNRV